MAARRIGHIDSVQPAAGGPEAGPARWVVQNPEGELAVVIVDLFCTCHAVKVQGEEVSVVDLEVGDEGRDC